MITYTLYRFKRADGGVTHSLQKPNESYDILYRLVAENKKVITQNGIDLFTVIDTRYPYSWYEIDAPNEFLHSGDLY